MDQRINGHRVGTGQDDLPAVLGFVPQEISKTTQEAGAISPETKCEQSAVAPATEVDPSVRAINTETTPA
jgi:hypothetical protein